MVKKKKTEQILIDDKRPTEQADLDRKDKQSIEDKLDTKSIVEEDGVIMERYFNKTKSQLNWSRRSSMKEKLF